MAEDHTEREFADEGYVVLVHIPVSGGPRERAAYVVGCATPEEAVSEVRELYRDESTATFYCAPLRVGDTKGLKLGVGEVRPWQ